MTVIENVLGTTKSPIMAAAAAAASKERGFRKAFQVKIVAHVILFLVATRQIFFANSFFFWYWSGYTKEHLKDFKVGTLKCMHILSVNLGPGVAKSHQICKLSRQHVFDVNSLARLVNMRFSFHNTPTTTIATEGGRR